MEKILVSACLLGLPCRYDGKSVPCERVIALKERFALIPFCPEIYGGLKTPRIPAECVGTKVINAMGEDVTDAYRRGAEGAVAIAELLGCKRAILKQKSPACGTKRIYDGTFSDTLIPGAGVCAQALAVAGVSVCGEDDLKAFE